MTVLISKHEPTAVCDELLGFRKRLRAEVVLTYRVEASGDEQSAAQTGRRVAVRLLLHDNLSRRLVVHLSELHRIRLTLQIFIC